MSAMTKAGNPRKIHVRCIECGRKGSGPDIRTFPGWCGWCRYNFDLGRPVNAKGKPWSQRSAAVNAASLFIGNWGDYEKVVPGVTRYQLEG